jgi:V/A-type H+-transporting ATPase subunit A
MPRRKACWPIKLPLQRCYSKNSAEARHDEGRVAAMSEALIRWIGGPVLHAQVTDGEFRIGEAIEVGPQKRPGEVIRLKGDELVGQVYEDTTGLKPGDAVHGHGGALSVRLGPNLLGRIFDGLLRPLDDKQNSKFGFKPLVKKGDTVSRGAAIGE